MTTRHPGSLLKELDLDKAQFLALVTRAAELKRAKAEGTERLRLTGKNIALIFEKSSTRTRCAFDVAAHDQGAHTTYLGPEGSHIGREESIPDTARVLGRMFDGIEFRGFAQDTVEQLADHAGVPVWNGLTDSWHPTQMLADILTMTEHHPGPVERSATASLATATTSSPLAAGHRRTARRLAETSGAHVLVTEDVGQSAAGVDFVYTDVWVSMGEPEQEWDKRVPMLLPYQVTEQVLHCLPARHDRSTILGQRLHDKYGLDGTEVTDDVFESQRSIVFDQAENRLHTIKAVLVAALAG
jgi:ornithine carbamoyltransferase